MASKAPADPPLGASAKAGAVWIVPTHLASGRTIVVVDPIPEKGGVVRTIDVEPFGHPDETPQYCTSAVDADASVYDVLIDGRWIRVPVSEWTVPALPAE